MEILQRGTGCDVKLMVEHAVVQAVEEEEMALHYAITKFAMFVGDSCIHVWPHAPYNA